MAGLPTHYCHQLANAGFPNSCGPKSARSELLLATDEHIQEEKLFTAFVCTFHDG